MRVLLFVFILLAANSVINAQTPGSNTFEAANVDARAGRYTEALEKYRAVLRDALTDPLTGVLTAETDTATRAMLARVHFNIGVCLYQTGRPQEAVAEYEKAAELSGGKYQKVFYAMGMAEVALGRAKEAKAAFYRALELNKNDGEAWFDLGLVLLAQEDEKYYDDAVKAFESAVKNGSVNTVDAINNIGVIAALKGDLVTAEKKFQEALQKGASAEAAGNLKICARFTRGADSKLIAGLIFSRIFSR
jgi:tetratricopeptide (TPR) repeat protein